MAVPLFFRREKVRRREAESQLAAARAERDFLRQTIERETRVAWERLRLARARTQAARRLRDIQKAKRDAEERQFARGRSTTDLVIRFQNDLRQAEKRTLQAQVDETVSRVLLDLAMGTLETPG